MSRQGLVGQEGGAGQVGQPVLSCPGTATAACPGERAREAGDAWGHAGQGGPGEHPAATATSRTAPAAARRGLLQGGLHGGRPLKLPGGGQALQGLGLAQQDVLDEERSGAVSVDVCSPRHGARIRVHPHVFVKSEVLPSLLSAVPR